VSVNTVLEVGGNYTYYSIARERSMSKICDDTNQTDQLRFWVSELTAFSPKQVDSVVEVLKSRKLRPVDRMAS
jgi:hypothetical protein